MDHRVLNFSEMKLKISFYYLKADMIKILLKRT